MVKVYDLEIYSNFFCLNMKILNQDKWFRFAFDEFCDVNQFQQLENVFKKKSIWVAFNQLHYDNVILNFIFANYRKKQYQDPVYFLQSIKRFSDTIINSNYEDYKEYKYSKPYHFVGTNIDLFLYWSKGLRISKKISLKSLGIGLRHYKLQELPYPPNKELDFGQQQEVAKYCDNDVIITEKIYNDLYDTSNTKTGSVLLRHEVVKQTGFDCYSWDIPKIASETLAKAYSEKTKIPIKTVNNLRFQKPSYIRIGDLFKDLPIQFETKQLQQVWENIQNSINTVSEEFVFKCNNTAIKISIGIGGIHSVNKNEKYFTDDQYDLYTSDVASLYPTNIINAQTIRFPEVLDEYIETKRQRLIAKKEGDKATDKFKKLILNSTSGLLDSEYSWLYYPEGALKLRLLGQLQLLMLIEQTSLNGFKIVSTNTDGIELLIPKDKFDDYLQIVNKISKLFDIEFEHEQYKAIYYLSVNDYLAILSNGKTKKKGSFVTNPELGDSVDFLIIPKALEAYFVNGIRPEKFIPNHINSSPEAIYDYCMSPKVDKSYHITYKGQQIHQRLNRFYPTKDKNAGYINKVRDGSEHSLLKDSPVILFNDYSLPPYDINYQYFISKVNKTIDELEPKQLTLF